MKINKSRVKALRGAGVTAIERTPGTNLIKNKKKMTELIIRLVDSL